VTRTAANECATNVARIIAIGVVTNIVAAVVVGTVFIPLRELGGLLTSFVQPWTWLLLLRQEP
jgi:hypothetical protein